MGQKDHEPILATGGYDHTIKIWAPYSGTSTKTLQHSDSQVGNEISCFDGKLIYVLVFSLACR
jgi:WD40 repeat protein